MDQKPQPYPLPPENPHLGLSPVRSGPFAARNADARYTEHLRSLHDLISAIASDVNATKEDFEDLSTRSRDNGQALERLMREIKGVREDDGVSQKLTGLAQLDHLQKLDKLRYLGKLNKLDSIEETLRTLQVPDPSGGAAKTGAADHDAQDLDQLGHLKQLDNLEKLGQLSLLGHLKKLNSLEHMETKLDHLKELDRLKELQHLQQLQLLEQLKHLDKFAAPSQEAGLGVHFDELKAMQSDTSKRLERLPNIEEQVRANGADHISTMLELRRELEGLARSGSVQELAKQVQALHDRLAAERERPSRPEQSTQANEVAELKSQHKQDFHSLCARLDQQMEALRALKASDEAKALEELTSKVSTVSASLHELSQLSELSRLQSLENLAALDQLSALKKLDSLESLEELKSLQQLSSLSRLDELEALDSLKQLADLDRLSGLKKLDSLDSLKSLEELKSLPAALEKLGSLHRLESLDKLESLDSLASLEKLDSLKKLELLDGLAALSKLESLGKLNTLDRLASLDQLESLDALGKLEALDQLAALGQINDIRGEIRAVQDHLVGMHKDALQELGELRQFKQEAAPVKDLRAEAAALELRVEKLRAEERELQSSTAALKTELRLGVERLEECETRYAKLETQLRDLTLAKYKGILGTGAMAVLSKTQNKENELVMPKRQLRTVSLANH